jgi:hypothetical protein
MFLYFLVLLVVVVQMNYDLPLCKCKFTLKVNVKGKYVN